MDEHERLANLMDDLKNTPGLGQLGYGIFKCWLGDIPVLFVINNDRLITRICINYDQERSFSLDIRDTEYDVTANGVKELLRQEAGVTITRPPDEVYYKSIFPNLAAKKDFCSHDSRIRNLIRSDEGLWCFQYWEDLAMREKLEEALRGHRLPLPIKLVIID
jgi:hypothetical protein